MTTTKKKPILIKIDPETLDRIDLAVRTDMEMEGNRSMFIRRAIREKLDRCEATENKEAA